MINEIHLKSGPSEGEPNLQFDVQPITIFVGPNNSGKSKVLMELEDYSKTYQEISTHLVIQNLSFSPFTKKEIEEEISKIRIEPPNGKHLAPGRIIISKIGFHNKDTSEVSEQNLINEAANPNHNRHNFIYFLKMYTMRLDGTNRLNLLREQSAGDLQETPGNYLTHLFHENELRKKISQITYDAFGKYYVIDPTHIGHLRVRLSDEEPTSEHEEKGLTHESVDFHHKALDIQNTSDGMKAFLGIITALLACDPKIILIDEPEAFLHPSLSNKLGKEIGKSLLGTTKKRFFASTHSPNFLMGCIQSGSPLNIVRLTYKNGVATSRILPKEKILKLMRNPLLRSTGVLNGLFYESVIVTEADSDRAFYQEINERLLANNDDRGISNCLFINAQNKQTIWDIVKPLRELGIPAVGIVDIDVLKDGGKNFSKVLKGIFMPELSHSSLGQQRQVLKNSFEDTGKEMKIDGGVEILNDNDKASCNDFLHRFEEYGAFVVRNGELESWLPNLGITSEKSPAWLIEAFEKMGEDPEDDNYLKPAEGDVWDFMGEIRKWIDNNEKKGIPKNQAA